MDVYLSWYTLRKQKYLKFYLSITTGNLKTGSLTMCDYGTTTERDKAIALCATHTGKFLNTMAALN